MYIDRHAYKTIKMLCYMSQKSFFVKQTPEEMRNTLKVKQIFMQRSLVDHIWNLDKKNEAIEIRTSLIPAAFRAQVKTQARASRKNYKHGLVINLDQPQTREQAYEYPYTPLIARMRSLETSLRDLREEEINFIGLAWHPVQTRDRRWRVVPFDAALEGTKLYDYAVNRAGNIEVNEKYTEAAVVQREGGQVFCSVPSRTKGRKRYNLTLMNVPIKQGKEKNAIIWGLKSQYEIGAEPERTTFLHHLRYAFASGSQGSDILVFGPHEVAAYLAVIRKYWDGLENTVPLEMNPFPFPSKAWASFYDALNNNVMIYDPTLVSKDKLRNLHLDEKCMLLARSIKVKGAYETAFWDPQRDGQIKKYWK